MIYYTISETLKINTLNLQALFPLTLDSVSNSSEFILTTRHNTVIYKPIINYKKISQLQY